MPSILFLQSLLHMYSSSSVIRTWFGSGSHFIDALLTSATVGHKDFHHRCFCYFPTSLKYKTSSFGHRPSNSNICVQHHLSVVGIYLYYDASIEYFGKKHLPYVILAVFVALTFILFPLLLLLLYLFSTVSWLLWSEDGMLFTYLLMLSRVATKMEQMGLEIANTLQLCTSF